MRVKRVVWLLSCRIVSCLVVERVTPSPQKEERAWVLLLSIRGIVQLGRFFHRELAALDEFAELHFKRPRLHVGLPLALPAAV